MRGSEAEVGLELFCKLGYSLLGVPGEEPSGGHLGKEGCLF